jgi:hypothetical protein
MVLYFIGMSTLSEIEAAVEALPPTQQQELLRHGRKTRHFASSRFVAVFEIPPVESPITAVRA